MTGQLVKILYVEDDESISLVVTMTLEDLGDYEVLRCASGRQALATVTEFAPQLILMDVMMPEMDGLETLRELRQMESAKNIPVIFMTAKGQSHEQTAYLEQGAIGVIVKPFDPFRLCAQIETMWRRPRAANGN